MVYKREFQNERTRSLFLSIFPFSSSSSCYRRFRLFYSGIKSLHLLFRHPGDLLSVSTLFLDILTNLSVSIPVTYPSHSLLIINWFLNLILKNTNRKILLKINIPYRFRLYRRHIQWKPCRKAFHLVLDILNRVGRLLNTSRRLTGKVIVKLVIDSTEKFLQWIVHRK